MNKATKIGIGTGVVVFGLAALGSCGHSGNSDSTAQATPEPTPTDTPRPTAIPPTPTDTVPFVDCSFVMSASGSEVGVTVHISSALGSVSGCALFRKAIDGANSNGMFKVTELDGKVLDFTTAGSGIVELCDHNGIKVYDHPSDYLSAAMGSGLCSGLNSGVSS